jgi:group I intron endonuclease
LLKDLYPQMPKGQGQWGIYIWCNMAGGKDYVGSTQVLWKRLKHYWKDHNGNNLQKILADIKIIGIGHFELMIYDLPVHLRELRLLLALEQYYLLSLNPQNNTLYVAKGSPGGMAIAENNRMKNSF